MHRTYYLCLFLLLIAEAGSAQVKQWKWWESGETGGLANRG